MPQSTTWEEGRERKGGDGEGWRGERGGGGGRQVSVMIATATTVGPASMEGSTVVRD